MKLEYDDVAPWNPADLADLTGFGEKGPERLLQDSTFLRLLGT